SLGFSANVGLSKSETQFDLIDVNGDGLPDKVFRNGTVELNFGYRFSGVAEGWGGGVISDGRSLDAGGGLNAGFNKDFYSFGGGLSLTIGESKSEEIYTDINGDGLIDKILVGSPLMVRLNTGSGFTAPIPWPGGQSRIAVDKHVSLGAGVFFTIGIPIPPIAPVTKIVFNPGVHTSINLGRPEFG